MVFSLPFSKKEKQKEYYFGIYLSNDKVVGMVFEIHSNNATIVAHEVQPYSNGWDSLVEDVDKIITALEAQTNIYLEKTIYFLHSYIIDTESHEIKNPYKDLIKNLSKQLELKPLGFIELHEGVQEFIKERDQSPVNAILTELDPSHVGIFVYKGGKLVFHQYSARTSELVEDMGQVLQEVHVNTMLPSKIIVYGSQDERLFAELTKHHWENDLFIQPPRVEVIKEVDLYQALANIFAVQMNESDATAEVVEEKEQEPEMAEEQVMGFVIGKDIQHETNLKPPSEEPVFDPRSQKPGFDLKSAAGSFFSKLPSFTMPKVTAGKGGKLPFNIALISIPVVLLLIFFGIEVFLHKTNVTVYVPAQKVTKQIDLTLPIAESSSELALISHTISSDFSDERTTTGKRDIGEKATGEVSILNFDTKEKSFAKGTRIQSGSLAFTLNQDVRVASASGVNSTGAKQAGRAKVGVTAVAIGPESNLEKGKQLTVADQPESLHLAVVESAFSGGSKKTVRTVSQKDLDDLETALAEKAKEQSNIDLKGKIPDEEELIETLTEVELKDVEYSKEVGEESDSVSVKATSEMRYYTLQKKNFKKTLSSSLKDEVPSGFVLDDTKVAYNISQATKGDDNNVSMKLEAESQARKDVSSDKVKRTITGTSLSDLEDKLKTNFDSTGYEVKSISPPIPFFNNRIPFFQNNITITISSK